MMWNIAGDWPERVRNDPALECAIGASRHSRVLVRETMRYMAIRVVMIGDHLLVLQAVSAMLKGDPDITVVASDTGRGDLSRLVREARPDVVILDLSVRGNDLDPAATAETLKRGYPAVEILALIGRDDGVFVRGLVDAGVTWCLFNDDERLLSLGTVLRRVSRGERGYSQGIMEMYLDGPRAALTPNELAILRLAAEGLSNHAISKQLMIADKTVRNSLSAVYTKMDISRGNGVNSRVEAINRARELGLLRERAS